MNILINNPVQSTQIFLVLFLVALFFSWRKKTETAFFSMAVTQELKGLAVLAIVFAHVGYYLVTDHRFLFPLTIAAGVGVNMFLFLSGYGLTLSALAKKLSIRQFYLRRLPKLYVPFWLSCLLFLGLDFLVSGKHYGFAYVAQTLFGFFPRADIALDLNSPLWYFSFIIFYYLLYPLVFFRRYPWASAGVLYLAGYLVMKWDPPLLGQVMRLYQVHILAFPLGVLFASLVTGIDWPKLKSKLPGLLFEETRLKPLKRGVYWLVIISLLWAIGYTAYFSHVGDVRWIEELVSLLTMSVAITLFLLKKIESRLLNMFGIYSYEIYLLHWPLLSRFDIFYHAVPAWLATSLYLVLFIIAGYLLQLASQQLSRLGK